MRRFERGFVAAMIVYVFLLGGCSSGIKAYDSTFTSTISTPIRLVTDAIAPATLPLKPLSSESKPYFLEFRARKALSYGHLVVVFGKLDKNGKVPVDGNGILDARYTEISGLHPATTSTIPWSVGHLVPVPAETGPSDGDFEDEYITARYTVRLNEREFRRVVAIVYKHKKLGIFWFAPVNNCVWYVHAIGKEVGLKVPPNVLFPDEYVRALKALNSKT